MTNLSLDVRTKEVSALRRWHKRVKISLGRIAKTAFAKPLVRDTHPDDAHRDDVYRDNEYNMQHIVAPFVQVCLEDILYAARRRYPHITDTKQLIRRVVFNKPMIIKESQIYILAQLIESTGQKSHCTAGPISSYIVRSLNDNREEYGVVATVHFGAIVIAADTKISRKEILDLFDEA